MLCERNGVIHCHHNQEFVCLFFQWGFETYKDQRCALPIPWSLMVASQAYMSVKKETILSGDTITYQYWLNRAYIPLLKLPVNDKRNAVNVVYFGLLYILLKYDFPKLPAITAPCGKLLGTMGHVIEGPLPLALILLFGFHGV